MFKSILMIVSLIILGIFIIQFGSKLSHDATDVGCGICSGAKITHEYIFFLAYGFPTKPIQNPEFCTIAGCQFSAQVPIFIDVYVLGVLLIGI